MALVDVLCDWFGSQPAWQQDLARRLTTSVELDASELAVALSVVYASLGIDSDGDPPEPQLFKRDDVAAAADGPMPRLVAFGHLRGVGLVVDDGELTFGPNGLTLIYGQNAAGKSSYVRALKMLCRTADRGCRVRSNIYDDAHEVPSAQLEIEVGGVVTSLQTPLEGKEAKRLPGMAVFDSACAELYIDARNTIQYIPSELLLLTRLAAAQDRMRRLIDAELADIRSSTPPLGGFPARSKVTRTLAELKGGNLDADLEALATLTNEESSRLAQLRAAVAAADADTGRTDALAARHDADSAMILAESLATLAARADAVAVQRLRAAAAAHMTAQETVKLANEVFADAPVAGIGGDAWRALWNAAREFLTGAGGAFPPAAGQACPLCLQKLEEQAADRLAHFERHITSAVQNQAIAASATLAEALADSDAAHAANCNTDFLAGLRAREPHLAAQVDTAILALADHLRLITANPIAAEPVADVHIAATAALTKWAHARSADANHRLSAESPGRLAKMRDELAELKARQLLSSRLEEFRGWQDRLRRAAALDRARSALATNKITIKQRQLADRHLSTTLKRALARELMHLKCNHLPVGIEMQTARAHTTIGLRLLSPQVADLSDVASEGERRAVAIAFFFAELDMLDNDTGIIVDDPVSSLDDERRRYIADRLADEAQRRQVIVFSHDLPFLLDLQDEAKNRAIPVHMQGVWRLGQCVGRVDSEPPFKVMNLKQRVGRLKEKVAQWDSQATPSDFNEAWSRASGFYADLRTSWERAVEERLFRGVVQRFQREVKTLALKDVNITPQLVQQIETGMTRSSMFMHDEPPGASVSLPSRTQLAADLDLLVQFEQQTRAK